MRKLRNLFNSTVFYQVWLLVVVLGFLIAGGGILSRNIYQKIRLIWETRPVIKKLNEKSVYLNDLLTTLNNYDKQISILEKDLVSPLNIPEYMIDFVLAASRAGYSVDRFTPSAGSSRGTTKITLTLTGYKDTVPLLKSIEGLQRITNIETLSINTSGDKKSVSMTVSVFSGKEP